MPLTELKKQLIVLSKVSKNSNTVIFKCINIVDRQRFDITVIKPNRKVKIRDFNNLEHKYLVSSTFYEASNNIIVQVSKSGIFDLPTALRKNKLRLNENTIRSLLYNMLNVLKYCQSTLRTPFRITVSDLQLFRDADSAYSNFWTFKLKNCFLENQFNEFDMCDHHLSKMNCPNASFFNNECIVSAIVKLGTIIFNAIKNIYGYNSPLGIFNNSTYSSSLRYVINCMMNYKALKSPPSLSELLLFFQSPEELYMEKLRSALFEGVKIKKEMFNEINNCITRSKSCFF